MNKRAYLTVGGYGEGGVGEIRWEDGVEPGDSSVCVEVQSRTCSACFGAYKRRIDCADCFVF